MEAEKSHYIMSTNWRGRKAGVVIQFKSEGLRTRKADGVTPIPNLKAREMELGEGSSDVNLGMILLP